MNPIGPFVAAVGVACGVYSGTPWVIAFTGACFLITLAAAICARE